MATLSFEGESHGELVVKVRRWLASVEGQDEGNLTTHEAIEQGAELTKEALRIMPPVPSIPRRAMRDFDFGGYRIPAGTSVGDASAEARSRGGSTELNLMHFDWQGDRFVLIDAVGSLDDVEARVWRAVQDRLL